MRRRPKQFGGPVESLAGEPGSRKDVTAAGREHIGDGGVVGLRRGGGEGERDLPQPELEQAIAAAGLGGGGALWRGPGGELDLAVIWAPTAIDPHDLPPPSPVPPSETPVRPAPPD